VSSRGSCRASSADWWSTSPGQDRSFARISFGRRPPPGRCSHLAPQIVAFIARKLGGNGHLLTGAVNRLGLYAVSFPGQEIDEIVVDSELGELLRAVPRVSVAEIQGRVAQYFGIPVREMTSARRGREVARPRQVAMYLSKQLTPKSLPDIGRRFGGRDHTTVIHGIRQVERLRETDCDIDRAVLSLTRELQQ
jgi:chromosomal replication initiator protein